MGTPKILPELPADQDDGDPVEVADQDRPREVVGDPAEPDDPAHDGDGPDQHGQHGRQGGVGGGAAGGQGGHRGHHQQGQRALGPDDELPGGPEDGVGDGRQQQGVEPGHRGEPGQLGVGHGRGDGQGGHGDAGDGVPPAAALGVAGELGADREGPGQDRRPLAGLERGDLGVVAIGVAVVGGAIVQTQASLSPVTADMAAQASARPHGGVVRCSGRWPARVALNAP